MVNFQFNQIIKKQQIKLLITALVVICIVIALFITLSGHTRHKRVASPEKTAPTGVISESFTEANTQSAMLAEQQEIDALKTQMQKLHATMGAMMKTQAEEISTLNQSWESKLQEAISKSEQASTQQPGALNATPTIHHVSFRKPIYQKTSRLDPTHYVPSNTSVRAVVLGGADADASVYGQSKNNGVMLFKLLDVGSLPNGQRSRLQGCRVSANTFGDISSERAFATLYRLSCAHPGEPIIDKEITGWVFYNGKVGIKGQPLMRDGKVMAWAGVSGALSGVAEAAQYAQSMQQFGTMGASSVVPSSKIGHFAMYGGASKAAEKLSEYYVKRAEQYHPVIQIGSGNIVTIVFKDGFYLEPDKENKAPSVQQAHEDDINHFNVPPEVLNHIEQSTQPGVSP